MNVGIPRTSDQKLELAHRIETVSYFVPSDRADDLAGWDLWLGSSSDGPLWVLFATESRHLDDVELAGVRPEHLVAYLRDPPKRNKQTIGEILLAVYQSSRNNRFLSANQIQSIAQSIEFPTYRTVGDFLSSAPEEWRQLPAELVVGFELSEGGCVYGALFEEYRRDSLEEAVATVCRPRLGWVLLHYKLVVRELVPLTPYEVDWPLSRRGKEDPIRRDKTQGDLPWEEETSTALVVLHQHVSRCVGWMGAPSFFAEPVVRLTVAGRDEAKAISNWQMIAKELRRFRRVRSAGLSRDGNVIDSRLPDKHIDEHY